MIALVSAGVRTPDAGGRSALADEPPAQGVDPLLDLVRPGLRHRRATAGRAKRRVHGRVRLAGAPGPGTDQLVQLLAQARHLPMRGRRTVRSRPGGPPGPAAPPPGPPGPG